MTLAATKILETFETLGLEEKQRVAAEILRRSAGVGEIPFDAFEHAADEILSEYDAEEEAAGGGKPR